MNCPQQTWIVLDFAKRMNLVNARPVSRTVAGQSLVTYTSSKGTVFVAENVCPHRGAALHQGRVRGNCLVCPYHAMAVSPSTHADQFIETVTTEGVVWVDSGLGAQTSHKLSAPPPTCPEFTDARFRTIEYTKRIPVNPVLMTENTIDWKHLSTVHRFSLVDGDPIVTLEKTGPHGLATYAYELEKYSLLVENEYHIPFTTSLRFKFTDRETGNELPSLLLWFSVTPVEKDVCDLHLRISRATLKFFPLLTDAIFRLIDALPLFEDVSLVRNINASMWSQNSLVFPQDAFVAEYREAMTLHCPHILRDFVY